MSDRLSIFIIGLRIAYSRVLHRPKFYSPDDILTNAIPTERRGKEDGNLEERGGGEGEKGDEREEEGRVGTWNLLPRKKIPAGAHDNVTANQQPAGFLLAVSGIWTFCSSALSFPGAKSPSNIRSVEHSLPISEKSKNFRSLELLHP